MPTVVLQDGKIDDYLFSEQDTIAYCNGLGLAGVVLG